MVSDKPRGCGANQNRWCFAEASNQAIRLSNDTANYVNFYASLYDGMKDGPLGLNSRSNKQTTANPFLHGKYFIEPWLASVTLWHWITVHWMLLSHLRTLYFMHYKPGLISGLIPGLSYSHRSTLGLVWHFPYSLFYTKGQEITKEFSLPSIPRKTNNLFS